MSRPWAAGALAALGIRLALALLTEFREVFPAYYFNDAALYDSAARRLLEAWSSGDTRSFLAPGLEAYAIWTATLYRLFGAAPIHVKLSNAFLGLGAVLALSACAAAIYGRRGGLVALWLAALWPSHSFYTSQHFKEAPTLLLLSCALAAWAAVPVLRRRQATGAALAAGLVATVGIGFFRSHLVPFVALGGATGAAVLLLRRGRSALGTALPLAVAACAGAALYGPVKAAAEPFMHGAHGVTDFLRPVKVSERPEEPLRPTSPRGITEYRRARMHSSRVWSRSFAGREIETEFFPDAAFETWLDVALFLPKASFHELFMPLPGLYPMGGKLGRKLAATENVLLLAGVALAALGLWRARRRPAAWALAAFFCALTPAAALFEFDLGSASRHRLQPLSAALPLAAGALARRRRA